MSETNKPYKCVYCGRRFSKPTAHKCKDGFRKHHLEFDYTPTEEESKRLEEATKSFFDELDNVVSDLKKVDKDDCASFVKNANRRLESILSDTFGKLTPEKAVKDIWMNYLKCTNRGLESILPQGIAAASPLDTQVGGDHYKKYKIQPIEFAMANGLNACQTNILKYIMRYKDKDGKKDLEKARHYIDILIQTEYPNE